MKCRYLILLAMTFFLLTAPPISRSELPENDSQVQRNSDQDPLVSKDREIWETVETLRESHLIKELELSGERANSVIETMRYARNIKKRYLFQRYQIENKLDSLLEIPDPDHTEITKILKELEIARGQYYYNILEADNELRAMLSPEEQAKYILFQRNFNKKLQEVIGKIRQQSPTPTPKRNLLLRRQNDESVIRQPR